MKKSWKGLPYKFYKTHESGVISAVEERVQKLNTDRVYDRKEGMTVFAESEPFS